MIGQLSAATSSSIDWARVNDGLRLVLSELGPDRGHISGSDSASVSSFAVDGDVVRRAFDRANEEFRRVLEPTRKGLRLAFAAVTISLGVAISGAAVSFLNPWGGGVLSVAGLGTMLGFLRRAWELSRDQAMLELVPARYELALSLSTTPQQYGRVLQEFLKETAAMRRN